MAVTTEARGLPRVADRYGDLILAIFVVGVVGMMILPLPTWVLDILLTLNIGVSVTLLMMAVYVPDALRFSSFPTLLLITTLFRLALNVSSTRLILAQADAGEVIRAFGHFVTQGNLVVGAVVFLILTLIQFIVIAKGAERVAEVAARFTLDAMPGKQMSIDADLRAGAFDLDEARRRRASIQRESQLYGAMDGAMKFVKGDAIAGIVIIVVNIVGGLAVGTLQNGMTASDALDVYSILTIGDGLVSQIPALIVSVAAGMIVTRVASEEEGAHLGKDIGGQILRQPKAIAVTSGLLLALSIVPGMPLVPFLLLGGVGALTAASLLRQGRPKAKAPARKTEPSQGGPHETRKTQRSAETVGLPDLLTLTLSHDLHDLLAEQLALPLAHLRGRTFEELGLMLAAPAVAVMAQEGAPRSLAVWLSDVPIVAAELPVGEAFARTSADALQARGLAATDAGTFLGLPLASLGKGLEASAAAAKVRVWRPMDLAVAALEHVVRKHAHELLSLQDTQRLLDSVEKLYPALVREVVPKLMSLQLLTDVLRRLLEEQVSIRDLRTLLGAMADFARSEKDPVMLTEHARAGLRRAIVHELTAGGPSLRVLLLDPLIEDTIRNAIQRMPTGSYLALEPDTSADILAAVRRATALLPEGVRPVILTGLDIRRFVRRLCEAELPTLAVVSYQELPPELEIQPIARVTIG